MYILFLKKELVREVEMGPFRHTVDDGLDIRKVLVCHTLYTLRLKDVRLMLFSALTIYYFQVHQKQAHY